MSKIQNEEQIEKKEFKKYSDDELREFDVEMQKYKKQVEITHPSPDTITIYDEEQYLKDNKALNKAGAVIINDNYETKFRELNDKLEQWKRWVGRNEFIDKKKLEGLEELAQGMNV